MRFIFNTLEEAQSAAPGGFDIIVVGAGMYGAYCATKIFNFTKNLPGYRPRILVLQEDPFLIHEHFQNLPRGLGSLYDIPLAPLLPDGQYKIINSDGTPEGQGVQFGRDFAGKFRPHHRCVGGRLFWGGWTSSLTPADLAQWPAAVSDFLTSADGYTFVSQEIGADYDIDRNGKEKDFIYGTLYESLLKRSRAVVPFSLVSDKYSIHECGTLWMGDEPENSVTDVNGRFHHVANAYCADQALFTTAGSANPVPTGLGLARKVARSIGKRFQAELPFADGDAGFLNLFNGSFAGMWRTAGNTNFQVISLPGQPPIIEAGLVGVDSALGILYYTPKQFKNFVLRLEWKAFSIDANSGVFLRIPNPDGVALDDNFYAACTEIQIDETGKNFLANRSVPSVFGGFQEKTGAIYKLAPATQGMSKAIRPRFSADGAWNVYEITVQDTALIVALNGVKVSSANIAPPLQTEGFLAIQCVTPKSFNSVIFGSKNYPKTNICSSFSLIWYNHYATSNIHASR